MQHPVPDYLRGVLESIRHLEHGEVAQYIPELAQADPPSPGCGRGHRHRPAPLRR